MFIMIRKEGNIKNYVYFIGNADENLSSEAAEYFAQ